MSPILHHKIPVRQSYEDGDNDSDDDSEDTDEKDEGQVQTNLSSVIFFYVV